MNQEDYFELFEGNIVWHFHKDQNQVETIQDPKNWNYFSKRKRDKNKKKRERRKEKREKRKEIYIIFFDEIT